MTEIILISKIIFLLVFPVILAYRDYLIFPIKPEVSKTWHTLGFITRGFPAFFMLCPYYTFMPVYAFYFWLVFDEVTGVGHTAAIDKIPNSIYIKIIGLIISAFFPILLH